ncbi:MAG TPA: prolyl aminopeptidase [Pseudomonadales bacterium]|nr:prolyl aminopeptidase [Pseudomonadales bacterium]
MFVAYPDIKPYHTERFKLDELHEVYLEQCGDADGIPVLYLHGGPGIGCARQSRTFFDPDKYRIILYDQRGAGRSMPHAELHHNTTPHLIADIETIRQRLGIDRWLVFGGSWGSTLALLYAEQYPQQVSGLILRGIFLCRQSDIDWMYRDGGMNRFYPDYWEDFMRPLCDHPLADSDPVAAYYELLTGDNELTRMAAAKAWSLWEARCATLHPSHDIMEQFTDIHNATAIARIETHYFVNRAFIAENQILANAHKLRGIPGIIVHGRYDMLCRLEAAVALHNVWPDAELHIVREAGHAASEPGITDALIRATRDMARLLSNDTESAG